MFSTSQLLSSHLQPICCAWGKRLLQGCTLQTSFYVPFRASLGTSNFGFHSGTVPSPDALHLLLTAAHIASDTSAAKTLPPASHRSKNSAVSAQVIATWSHLVLSVCFHCRNIRRTFYAYLTSSLSISLDCKFQGAYNLFCSGLATLKVIVQES